MVPNGTSGQKEICSSADMLVPLLICVISARSDLHVLTQEKKSLPTNSDKSDGRTPSGESAETATAGNYSLSFEKVLLKFVFKFLKTKQNKKNNHSQPLLTAITQKLAETEISP